MAVRDQPSHEVDREVRGTPMAGMLNLEQALELVKHGFDECTATEDDFFVQQEQTVGHVALEMGHQADAPSLEQLTRQWLREVAFISEQATPEPLSELEHWAAVIDVAGRHLAGQQFTMLIDHDMQLEPIELAERGLPALSHAAKHPMLGNATIVADRQRGGIHERETRTRTYAGLQVGTERAGRRWHEFHEAVVADRVRELTPKVAKDIHEVVRLEVAKAHLVKMDHDGHDFAHCQLP